MLQHASFLAIVAVHTAVNERFKSADFGSQSPVFSYWYPVVYRYVMKQLNLFCVRSQVRQRVMTLSLAAGHSPDQACSKLCSRTMSSEEQTMTLQIMYLGAEFSTCPEIEKTSTPAKEKMLSYLAI